MRITIIPHNTGRVRQIRVSNFSIFLFLLLIAVPFIFRVRGVPDPSELAKNNRYLERELERYERECRDLTTKCDSVLSWTRRFQSVEKVLSVSKSESHYRSVDELLEALQALERISDEVYLKLEQSPELFKVIPSISPVDGYIIQTFGETDYIFTGERRLCRGVDFAAPEGRVVRATGCGIVKFAGLERHAGLVVEIYHGYGFLTKYSHLSFLKVRKGQVVRRGEVIGYVGKTGKTTGPRLHYEVWVERRPKDPIDFILTEAKFF